MMRMCSSGKISAEGHCDIVMLLSPPRVFLPIHDEIERLHLEGAKASLQGSRHRRRDLGGVTFLKRTCNDLPLAD